MPYELPDLAVTGQVIAAAWGNKNRTNWSLSPLALVTTRGDMVRATGANAFERFAVGAATHPLFGGTDPAYRAIARTDLPTIPTCRIKHTAGAHTINTATTVYLPFDAEDFDTDSMHDNATNNSRITINTPGVYDLWASFNVEGLDDFTWNIFFEKNRTTTLGGQVHVSITAINAHTVNIHCQAKLAAGDYVEVRVSHTDGSTKFLSSDGGVTRNIAGATWVGIG